MYLIGASGHAKVIIEILELLKIPVDGLFDDNPAIREILGYKVLGSLQVPYPAEEIIISIGNNEIRKRISQKSQLKFPMPIVHPSAVISPRSSLGEGTVVMGNAIVNSSCMIGSHVIINTSASVDHDCQIDDYVHVSPNATLSGGVSVGEGAHIGAGAVVIQGIKIGKWAVVGAGAVIIRDVEEYAVVAGNPGRIIRKIVK